jgi:hypothetical protein
LWLEFKTAVASTETRKANGKVWTVIRRYIISRSLSVSDHTCNPISLLMGSGMLKEYQCKTTKRTSAYCGVLFKILNIWIRADVHC